MDVTGDALAETAAAFAEAVSIMHRLRAPGGCPWDREQTYESIETYTLEEVYEVFEAISRKDWENLREELGDLLLQVLFYSEMAAEDGRFTVAEVARGLSRKLVRRHPHVFPNQEGQGIAAGLPVEDIDSAQVVRNWEKIKQAERSGSASVEGSVEAGGGRRRPRSRLEAIPRTLPALAEARKLSSSAHKVGFDWPEVEGVFAKLDEELAELREAMERNRQSGETAEPGPGNRSKSGHTVADEVGDLLFTAANLARHLGIDPERSLRDTNTRFRRRFALMESSAFRSGAGGLEGLAPAELEALWQQAKETLEAEQTDRRIER